MMHLSSGKCCYSERLNSLTDCCCRQGSEKQSHTPTMTGENHLLHTLMTDQLWFVVSRQPRISHLTLGKMLCIPHPPDKYMYLISVRAVNCFPSALDRCNQCLHPHHCLYLRCYCSRQSLNNLLHRASHLQYAQGGPAH